MKILSFDVAIKNLAYCFIDSNYDISSWDVVNILDESVKKPDFDNISKNLYMFLDKTFKNIIQDIDYVLIENQPVNKNPTMKSIQMIIYSYFLMKSYDDQTNKFNKPVVKLISAQNKLKVKHKLQNLEINVKSAYQKNKKIAVETARHYLKNVFQKELNQQNINLFEKHKKKDDLADCLLQAIWYIETNMSNK